MTFAEVKAIITVLGAPEDVTRHGMCWNTSGDPTIEDGCTREGLRQSAGEFSAHISGLFIDRDDGEDYIALFGVAGTDAKIKKRYHALVDALALHHCTHTRDCAAYDSIHQRCDSRP